MIKLFITQSHLYIMIARLFIWALTWGMLSIALFVKVEDQTVTFRTELESSPFGPGPISIFLYYVTMYYLKGSLQLAHVDSLVTSWFLHNGGIIHLAMEGISGGWHAWKEIDHPYRIIDNRFNNDVPYSEGGPHPDAALGVFIITQLELFMWTPLCMMTVIALTRGNKYRYLLAIVTSVCQIIGTVFFVVPPLVNGCLDLPPFDVPGCTPPFNLFNSIFVYLAFGSNFVWFVIPTLIIIWGCPKTTAINNKKEQ